MCPLFTWVLWKKVLYVWYCERDTNKRLRRCIAPSSLSLACIIGAILSAPHDSGPALYLLALRQWLIYPDLLGNSCQNFSWLLVKSIISLTVTQNCIHCTFWGQISPNSILARLILCTFVAWIFWYSFEKATFFRTHVEWYKMLSKTAKNGDNSKLCDEGLKMERTGIYKIGGSHMQLIDLRNLHTL